MRANPDWRFFLGGVVVESNQVIGLGTLILNLVPAQPFGIRTDGYVMLASLRGSAR